MCRCCRAARVNSRASAPSLERRLSQLSQRDVGEADIDRLSLHVEAAPCDPVATLPEHVVGRW